MALEGWKDFYVIVGACAGALIGLQFVVMALIADGPALDGEEKAGSAFLTPVIIMFSAVLWLSALLAVPWKGAAVPGALAAATGLAGFAYTLLVAFRMDRQTVYRPVLEDALFHVALPALSYLLLAAAGFALRRHAEAGLFGIAGASLLLLFTGIHNAWDTVLWLVYVRRHGNDGQR